MKKDRMKLLKKDAKSRKLSYLKIQRTISRL